ncbi:(2Fe-2S)-binding protein [Roseibium aggregatum]|uniref:(2Fe-2S)-binding protein n=1 Tax=Roseibium aggregatum TaxID=187304 RepID=UPI001A903A55|nr:(2Fe-2S)-binding protein [Roseibium aggregatum]MBN8183191.1 (2Fe-2S)-binding protein [Roseibium aggregatum]UES46742.1 2Fe-2S iron-sulfur cluster binding domain-containing protein [Roseibium aggregatum]
MAVTFELNGKEVTYDGDPETPLLWVIRDEYGLTGTKFGCGIAQCGACTVHVDGIGQRACITSVESIDGQSVRTIEGLVDEVSVAVKDAWSNFNVPQCGYCQSGQVMSAIDLLQHNPNPSDEDIDDAMSGNICRCASYVRIRHAIQRAAETLRT